MKRAYLIAIAAALLVAIAGGSTVAAVTLSGDDENVTGPEADKAIAAALELTGGGTANEVELDNEDGATWEVEVTRLDGSTVDVRLDENFGLVVIEDDSDEADDDDDDGEEDDD